ncbi:GH92 family glycosyl hydrolase [Spongiimicrobium sp. 3-5]|uniref:GH92 family glycosyl hydrolase n=1 Tax=Spongiimicrobium sp. 3-5 TaxID=3332596 RepID=UPI003980ACCB
MKNYIFYTVLFFLTLLQSCKEETPKLTETMLIDYVDPFIGTGGHGHTFPGATAPFGMVQPSPDNGTAGWDWCSGYHITDSIISGFGQLHLSGTGIGDLSDVLLMPTNKVVDLSRFGKTRDSLPYTSKFSHENESAKPGSYSVFLDDPKVTVSLTANDYVAFHKYDFKEKSAPSFILDLGYAVNWDAPLESYIEVQNPKLITGHRFSKGWAKNQKVFFAIEVSDSITKFTLGNDLGPNEKSSSHGIKASGQFFFDTLNSDAIGIKVALSSVSVSNAQENLKAYGSDLTFETVKKETERTWNELLSNIQVETPVDSLKTIFYTALYHTQLAPVLFSDTNGQFRLQNDEIAKSDGWKAYSTLSLWDIFRAETPLLSIMNPELINQMIQSMLVYYDEHGALPVWVLHGNETGTMPGYHSISVIAEAYLKGIRDYDIDKAYDAMKKTLMGDERGLNFYKEFGYIPYDKMDQSVSISLEYAYNDWCIAQMAKDLKKEEDFNYFSARSKAYQNFFDKNSGFLRGKSADGTKFHLPFDPKAANHIDDTDYTEGNAWQHSWYVLHDVAGLIDLHGGNAPFTKMLEELFTESSELKGHNVSPDISGLIGQYAHGNEPSHHIVYMFNKADTPWRAQYWAREILNTQYSTQYDGLSGNEDCGQMSAWYIFSSLGLYPMNPASGEYELGSPIFTKATIKLPDNKTFTINAPNTSFENKYVTAVTLNGKALQRTYITHEEIMAGGTLMFEMSATPNKH